MAGDDDLTLDPKWRGLDSENDKVKFPTEQRFKEIAKILQEALDPLTGENDKGGDVHPTGSKRSIEVHGALTEKDIGSWMCAQQFAASCQMSHSKLSMTYSQLIAQAELAAAALRAGGKSWGNTETGNTGA